MRLRFSSLVVLILALGLGTMAPGTQSRVAVPQQITDRVAAGDEVSVIVGVDAAFVPEGDLVGVDAVNAQRSAMRQAVNQVMARATDAGVSAGKAFEYVPYFIATVDRAQLEALATLPGVDSISVNGLRTTSLLQSVPLVTAPLAWAAGLNGAGWRVAILDTGVDKNHAFMGGKVASEACYSGGGPNSTSVCPGGVAASTAADSGLNCSTGISGCDHGTHVAGIAAGVSGSGNGVAPGAGIIAVQVFSRFQGTGPTGCGSTAGPCVMAWDADIISGLERVLALAGPGNAGQVAAVNMSLGGGQFGAACDGEEPAFTAAINNLRSIGVASVISSGNSSFSFNIGFPACISTAISVGATTDITPVQIASFSNDSPDVKLLAPGVDIISSVPGGGVAEFDGTSMAAPHVAGAWAILKQASPSAPVANVLAALAATGTPVTLARSGTPARSHPFININAARVALVNGISGGAPGAPTNFAVSGGGNALNLSWNAPAVADESINAGAATNYNLLARLTSGGPIVVNFPLGNVTSFAVSAPNGAFFLSVQATNTAGAGPESNVVAVTVPMVAAAPGSPTNLSVNVAGNSATFAWSAPTSGGPVGNYVLRAGNAPFPAAPLASAPLPPTSTSVSFGGIPAGVWYVRVFAQNAGVNSAFSTNEVQFTIAGPAPPGAPTMNVPTVSGNTVGLSWSPGAGGAPTSFTLIAALSSGGAPIVTAPGLTGTAVGFSGVPSGTYFLRLAAVNALGASPPSNEVTLVVP